MIIKKKFFLNKFCLFREKRDYLHSTDIFNQILYFIKIKDLKFLEINFKSKIINKPYIIFSKNEKIQKKDNYFVKFNYKKSKVNHYGFIHESNKKIILRKRYNEDNFHKKIKLTKKSVKVIKNTNFSFIERITSSAMKFLNNTKTLNDRRKWYLVRIKITDFKNVNKKNFLKIVSKKSNESINFFSIYEKKKVGEMLFLKK